MQHACPWNNLANLRARSDNAAMTTGYTTLTSKEVAREVEAMRKTTKKITATRQATIAFLVSAGILEKNGKRLASKYR